MSKRDPASAGATLRAIRTFLPYVRPHWRSLLPAAFAILGTTALGLLRPWPLKILIDDVLHVGGSGQPEVSPSTISVVVGAIVGLAALQGLLVFAKTFFVSAMAQRVSFAIRNALFAHLQRLSLAFHDRQRTGDLITRVTNDVSKTQELITDDLLINGATNVLQLVGILVVMLVIDWQLGLVAAASIPLIILPTAFYRGRIRTREKRLRAREGGMASVAQETISSIRVVKAFGREEFESRRFEQETGEMLEAGIEVSRLEASFQWTLNVVTSACLAALVGFGAFRVADGAVSAGTLVVFIQYMRDLQSPMTSLSRLWTKTAKVAVRVERLMEVLDEPVAVPDLPGAREAPKLRGEIRFDHVSFGYTSDQLVLRDIDFSIAPGDTVAIVGATGAGKSTLASLLLRLYDPVHGAVLVDGRDIREYKLASFVDQMSVVLQESLLFQATIRENISYGRPKSSTAEIEEAARLAYCDTFVEQQPQGLDTVVGERGATLSGGQRQRIAIARAVIRDAPILILDEPTTGLDAESEEIVMKALRRTMNGRTTLMIAHKFTTVRDAHHIYVMEDGRIAEHGTHKELLAKGGAYARAYQLQTA